MRPILRAVPRGYPRTASTFISPTNNTPIRAAACLYTSTPRLNVPTTRTQVTPNRTTRSFADHAGSKSQAREESRARARGIPDFDLSEKVILVTGGAGGLGVVQAEALLEAGATVYALDRRQDPGAALIALQEKAKRDYGTDLHYRQIDVRDETSLNATVENIASSHRRLDGLLACAGIQQEVPALDMSQADANNMLATNVTGVFSTAQAVARQMIKYGNGGTMAFVASMSGYGANRGLLCAAYNSSKAAVHQLGRSLAAEWGESGIRVNTISPGYIVTPMVEELFKQFPDRKVNWPKDNMLGRVSKPEDYRGCAVFLMSDASSYMTGADMRIDGGHMAW